MSLQSKLAHSCAHEMECVFKKLYPHMQLNADSFDLYPRESLETALEYLRLDGRIQEGEIADLMDDYDFGDNNLRSFFEKKDGETQYKELLGQIKNIIKRSEM